MIKNAIVYRAQLPAPVDMIKHLGEHKPRPLGSFESMNISFAAASDADRNLQVATFHGGYWIRMEVDEKVVPPSIVKQEADKEVKKQEENTGRKLVRAERAEIKEAIYLEMLETALIKTSFVRAYYHEESQLLFVDTSTKKRANQLLGALIHATESVKTTTIHVSGVAKGLTARLLRLTSGSDDHAFGDFIVDDTVKLIRKDERITFVDYDVANSQEIQELLFKGFKVDHLGLVFNSTHFKLTSDFHFKAFDWTGIEDTGEDEYEREGNRAIDEVDALVGIVERLCSMMEYKIPEAGEDQSGEEEKPDADDD